MNRILLASAIALLIAGSALPQSRGNDQKEEQKPPPSRQAPPSRDTNPGRQAPPERKAPPQREAPPQRQSPPPSRDTNPGRQAPPERKAPPQREAPPQRQSPPPSRDTNPGRQAPPERKAPPERQTPPPSRDTNPGRQAPPERKAPPQREEPPQRQTPPPSRDTNPGRQAPPPSRDTNPGRQAPPPSRDVNPGRQAPPSVSPSRPATPGVIDPSFRPTPPVKQDNGPAFRARTGGGLNNGKSNNFAGQHGPQIGPELRPTGSILPNIPDSRGQNSFQARIGDLDQFKGKLRWGYHNRDPRWRDWHFGYRYYCYQPIAWQCAWSPYYWYWSVPGYLPWNRCYVLKPRIIVILNLVNWYYCGIGSNRGFYNASYGNYTPLDRAVSDLQDAFLYRDSKALDRLVPSGGRVEIFIDNEYAYTIEADDYYDITADLIYSVETTGFDVIEVRQVQGNRGYVATARHDFIDSWGARQSTYLTFTLQPGYGGYVITQAGTRRDRPHW